MYSMTGYASRAGSHRLGTTILDWDWDMRAVNGRGLDLRLRLPDTLGFLEKSLRDRLSDQLSRGNVSLALRLRIAQAETVAQVDAEALEAVLAALDLIQSRAQAAGVLLQAPSALDLLAWRGVQQQGPEIATIPPEMLGRILLEDFDALLADFSQVRAQEGAALAGLLAGQLDEIARLTAAARDLRDARSADLRAHFERAMALVLESARADPGRIEQELALLAVKADLTEELDRLEAHCAAGHALLEAQGPVGRKLDFLTQEFNREANTLCSKAQHLEMTRIGLDLKTVIDQMREQVQNVE
ncbi:YicC/YloC family endoribonuclease [Natronohydrobacter thiooxidans]|uniref:YicC/YloC family endoribonuclease n=1 Tax=Natronohydrobacter thiooxidans TaxID=87172 RepID=UPI0008FF572B